MKLRFIVSISLVFCSLINAQQDPQYSQYMYNMSAVNPAYVVNQSGLIATGLLFRKQWTGLGGSPQTANAFANIPINERMEIGINYVNDRIGEAISVNNNYFNIDFAYVTRISSTFKLSYGLKAGVNSFKLSTAGSDVLDDPAFKDDNSSLKINLGAGLFLFSSDFYVGLSTPNLLPSDVNIDGVGVTESKTHIYAVSGFVFDVIDDIKLKPSLVLKQVLDSPLTFDVSINSLIYNRFELGVSYRYKDAFIALAGINITKSLKVGYSYDFSTSDLSGYNNGSHEIILLYNFDLLNFSNKYTSPRFF